MNYWEVLTAASARLEADDLIAAERLHAEAWRLRDRSPGRVFVSERVADAGHRLWGAVRGRPPAAATAGGRWREADAVFRAEFQRRGESLVRRALRLSDFSNAEPASAILPGLTTALHLLCVSRLFPTDATAAGRVLKLVVGVAQRAALPVDPALLRHDLPLTEEDRIWLAQKGDAWLAALTSAAAETGEAAPSRGATERDTAADIGGPGRERGIEQHPRGERAGIAAAILRVLDTGYFSGSSRHLDERTWLAAHLTDRHLAHPAEAVRLYRAYLSAFSSAAERAELARVRLVELLGNVDGFHFSVPRYEEALAVVGAGRPAHRESAARYDDAVGAFARRAVRGDEALVWGSLWLHGDGAVVVVWKDGLPCDVATWRPGEPVEDLLVFSRCCRGRFVRQDDAAWTERPELGPELVGEPIRAFVEALLEPSLSDDGLDDAALARIALTQLGPWQQGWDRRCGHPLLTPPARAGRSGALAHPLLGPALEAGLLWRACLERVAGADPALAAGVGLLARGGDPACAFLARFPGGERAQGGLDWDRLEGLLTELRARPAPWPAHLPLAHEAESLLTLTADPVVIVAAARPAATLLAWGASLPKLRLVLDVPGRFPDLGEAVAAAQGLVTLVPRLGRLHALRDALAWFAPGIATAIAAREAGRLDLLPLYHWIRVVETHNGDLRDHDVRRLRPARAFPLDARHAELAASLPQVAPSLDDPTADPWARQYAARARQSRVVAGFLVELTGEEALLDPLWGVQHGGDAAWVFFDSAAIHWRLWRAGGLPARELHARLSRRGDRHLSLILGGRFLAADLATLLGDWLAPYGAVVVNHCGPAGGPPLRLAAGGIAPDAHVLLLPALLGMGAHIEGMRQSGERAVLLVPGHGRPASWWRELASGGLPWPSDGPSPDLLSEAELWPLAGVPPALDDACLVVPALTVFDERATPDAIDVWDSAGAAAAWRSADQERIAVAARERAFCALEVAALCACGPAALDIADPRWWRRFPICAQGGVSDPGPRVAFLDGRAAAAAAAPGEALVYDLEIDPLPGSARARWRRRGADAEGPAARLRSALHERRWIDSSGFGPVPGLDAAVTSRIDAATSLPQGTRLLLRRGDGSWAAALRCVAEARERGDLRAWLLAVGQLPPPSAAPFVAAYAAAAVSVTTDEPVTRSDLAEIGSATTCGPLRWITPAALADAALQAELVAMPPTAAFASELRAWLPSAEHAASREAAGLRFLVGGSLPRVEISAPDLPPAWQSCLRDEWARASAGHGSSEAVVEEVGAGGPGGSAGVPRARDDDSANSVPSMPAITVGRLGNLTATCGWCGAPVALVELQMSCPECGLAVGTWLSPGARASLERDLLRLRLAGLADRNDLADGDRPLRVWLKPRDFDVLAADPADLGLTVCENRGDGRGLLVTPRTGVLWEVLPADEAQSAPDLPGQAVLWPPHAVDELLGLREDGGPLSLWYHPVELGELALPAPALRAARCDRMLDMLGGTKGRQPLLPGLTTLPDELAPAITGLPAAEVRAWLALVHWLSVHAGAPPPPASLGEPVDVPHLLTARRFVEIELHLHRLQEDLDRVLLPALSSLAAGTTICRRLAELAGELSPDEASSFDRLLITCSLRLRDEHQARPSGELFPPENRDELLWFPVDGLLVSERRRIGYLGDPKRVVARLRERLGLLAAAARELLALAEPSAGHLRIPWPKASAAGPTRDVLGLGLLQGWWRREGAAPPGCLDLSLATGVDGGPTVRERARSLYAALATERLHWEGVLRSGWATGLLQLDEPFDPAEGDGPRADPAAAWGQDARRVAAFLTTQARGVLVLRGLAGTGKLASALGGIVLAFRQGLAPEDLVVYCPDVATAARVHFMWRRLVDPWSAPPLEVVGATAPHSVPAGLSAGDNDRRVAILVNAEQVPREERHRLCLRHREERLLVTHDPVAAGEAWDHLLLSTPPAGAVIDCVDQKEQARRVWEETRAVAGRALGQTPRGKALRKERGLCQARYADNLDECLGLLTAEQAEGRLGARTGLIAALEEDLTYLGRSLGSRGWVPVFRWELDALLLPGPLEFLAAVGDAVGDEELLLPALLGPHERLLYSRWRDRRVRERTVTLRGFYDRVLRTCWGASFLEAAAARRRVEGLVVDAGNETLERFVHRPLWAAWRQEIAAGLGLAAPAARGPVVCLATPDTMGATGADLWLYLCLGNEAPARHYRVFSRAGDRLLILYQECSPLPGEAAALEG